MKIYLATDHAGFSLKEIVKDYLTGQGHNVEDCGAHALDHNDDFPDFISKAAEKISANPYDKAIIFGGSGQAEMMLANKYPGVRAALFYSPKEAVGAVDVTGKTSTDPYEIIVLAREHNDANILSLGARFLTDEEALEAVRIFLTTPFSKAERHERRLAKIGRIEKELHE
ncbi:MAG TPA: RpiB/LacA/LacB family sugar-phosphate isomerase [Patescibacteria group bacterium]|nr:RpiB/LacA/LacB family sugar-phosphate isomerase [Patescibacteria group bacterium]